jgi:hypothetical protein
LFSYKVLPSACPSSNGSRSKQRYPRSNYLDTTTSKRAIRPLNLGRLRKETTEHEKNNYTERRPKEKQLNPLGGCPISRPTKQEWLFAKHKLKP